MITLIYFSFIWPNNSEFVQSRKSFCFYFIHPFSRSLKSATRTVSLTTCASFPFSLAVYVSPLTIGLCHSDKKPCYSRCVSREYHYKCAYKCGQDRKRTQRSVQDAKRRTSKKKWTRRNTGFFICGPDVNCKFLMLRRRNVVSVVFK